MVRPRKNRIVAFDPDVSYFKPRGIPMIELEEVCLTVDGCESIRLADLIGMSNEEAGCRMGVPRATFGRIIQQAHKIIADALINGKTINIDGGKGGVGKTSVSVNLAIVLADKGYKVGIMDVDLHGPDVPRMLGLFSQNNITVVIGALSLEPEELVKSYIDSTLVTGDNVCDH